MKRWVAFGLAILLGALALGYLAWAQEGRMGEHRLGAEMFGGGFGEREAWGPGRHMSERLLAMLDDDHVRESLGLSDAQTGRLRQIIVSTEKASLKTGAEMAVRGIELRELLRADKPDSDAVMKKVDEISALNKQTMKDHVNAVLEAKTVLTPEQQKKIRAFVEGRVGHEGMREWFLNRRVPSGPGVPPEPPPAPPQPQ